MNAAKPKLRTLARPGLVVFDLSKPKLPAEPPAVLLGRRPRFLRPWRLALSLALLASGLALVSAQDPPKEDAWKAPARAARKTNPISVDPKTLSQGKDLFVMACVPCHGTTGRGDGPAAATLERNGVRVKPGNLSLPAMWQQTDGELFWKISEGRTPMPTWKESLNEEQRWLIVNYVRTLAPQGANTNSTVTAQSDK